MATRAEHIAWCKQRAREYLDAGDASEALASMLSDVRKHEETEDHPALSMGLLLKIGGCLSTDREVREFIEGFN